MRLYQTTGSATLLYGYDGTQRIAEYNGSGTLQRRYVFGPGDDEPIVWYEGAGTSDRRWLHADERGSVVAVSNASGASIATDSYDEYGVPGSGNVGAFQYTGQAWLADFGLYYYKARMYSSGLGRFMQTDPIGYGDGMNWYNYVGGDPVNLSDPSGLDALCGSGRHAVYFRPRTPTDQPGGSDPGGEVNVRATYRCENNIVLSSPGNGTAPRGGNGSGGAAAKAPQNKKSLPPCAQAFLKGRISGNPADIRLHDGGGGLPNYFDNSVTYGSDIYLADGMMGRSDRNALIHKFHEIEHTSQNARLGLSTFDHAAAYVVFGGHDASPYEQAADTFGQDAYNAYHAAGLDKTCRF